MELWNGKIPHLNKEVDFAPYIIPYIKEGAKAAVLVCGGGGYGAVCEHESEKVGEWFNSIGITAFVLKYRVEPYSAPAIPSDVQRAMRVARNEANKLGIEKLGVMGFSAGGHLAATASVHYDKYFYDASDEIDKLSARPDFSILCYPVIDMFDYRHDGTKNNIIGHKPTKEMRDFYSLYKQVTDDTPPAFLWHTCSDNSVPVENSMLYAKALSAHNISWEMHVYPYGPHGKGLADDDDYLSQWTVCLEKWIKEYIMRGEN